jgi:hypothetical protein
MRLRPTRRGWAEIHPSHCPGCGRPWGAYRVLVGAAQCRCASTHRAVFCRTCEVTFYSPPLGPSCHPESLDGRWLGRLTAPGRTHQRSNLETVPACTAPNCERPTVANGLCDAHDHRRARGNPDWDTPIRPYGVKGCKVKNCTREHTAKGLCFYHWNIDRSGPPKRHHRTPDEIQAILELHAAGVDTTEIANRFDCSRSTVARIIRRRT